MLITNQQQFVVKDTIKYCSIPTVPIRPNEVKIQGEVLAVVSSRGKCGFCDISKNEIH